MTTGSGAACSRNLGGFGVAIVGYLCPPKRLEAKARQWCCILGALYEGLQLGGDEHYCFCGQWLLDTLSERTKDPGALESRG